MINRRHVATFAAAAPAAFVTAPLCASEAIGKDIDLVKDWDFAPIVQLRTLTVQPTGLAPARNEEVAVAFRLLFNAPRAVAPLAVAHYFESLTERNAAGNPYNWEWPTPGRANPLIVGFFCTTNTLPSEGDQTSWCAAFVNFCLAVANKKLTGSALSGSFRTYEQETKNPQPGDIVVFKDAGERGNQGFGHVGFFLSRDDAGVEVLGGNQRGHTQSTGAVTRSKFSFTGGSLTVHSYRSIS